MTEQIDAVVLLSRALDQTGDVLARIREEQLNQPTPCRDWDVGRLITHVVAAPGAFLEMGRGNQPDWSAEPPAITSGWTTAFRSAADDLIHSWHLAGADADPDKVDWQTTEFSIHAWDLTHATGQEFSVDDEVAEQALGFLTTTLTPERRGQAFAAEAPAPADASIQDQLAAYAGRLLR